eukprot:6186103-Pleurochrysis_carterae.AAC.1
MLRQKKTIQRHQGNVTTRRTENGKKIKATYVQNQGHCCKHAVMVKVSCITGMSGEGCRYRYGQSSRLVIC